MINLSFVGNKPTGLSNYAINIVPHLQIPSSVLLTASEQWQDKGYSCYPIPGNLTSEHGTKGHLRRLVWTQFRLSNIYRKLRSPLLFSPVPEAPLFAGCRSVVMVHDLIPLHFGAWRSPLKYYFQYYVPLVLKQASHIVCNSQATANDVVEFCGIPANKISPIWLAHDANHFRFLDLPTQNYFIYLGRCDPHKNVGRIIAAFAQIPQVKDYELLIVGSTDQRYTPKLQKQAEELGVSKQIRWLDYVSYDQLPVLMNQAIALVFPSLWEGFGFPVLEAMACGTPVITSNRSSLPEVAGDAAILVNPDDTRAIAAAMYQVATDEGTRSHLRTAGLARAAQFSWAKTGQQTTEVLKQFL